MSVQSPLFRLRRVVHLALEQDLLLHEELKEHFYREAAQYLNTGERVSAESGDAVEGTLSFLTRGTLVVLILRNLP